MGYPADWDLIGTYTDQRTKDYIRMAVKNPLLLDLRNQFGGGKNDLTTFRLVVILLFNFSPFRSITSPTKSL
jgi:hypothetical protein